MPPTSGSPVEQVPAAGPTAARLDNVPRAMFEDSLGPRQKYERLVVGQPGLLPLLRYELITGVAGRFPGALGLWLRAKLYPRLLGACGRGVIFGPNVTLRHPHKIHIGDNVVIDDGAVLDAKGTSNAGIRIGSRVFIGRGTSLNTKDGDLIVEDGVNIGALCTVFSASRVRIGRDTLLAAYVYLVGGGHAFDRVDVATSEQPRPSIGIDVGPGGWLGAGVVVLDGAVLGEGVIVGANAVVRGDLPPYAVAAGVPATVRRVRSAAEPSPEGDA
jgi:acetyltransferase-like isoleucine patch superfamily enzyme